MLCLCCFIFIHIIKLYSHISHDLHFCYFHTFLVLDFEFYIMKFINNLATRIFTQRLIHKFLFGQNVFHRAGEGEDYFEKFSSINSGVQIPHGYDMWWMLGRGQAGVSEIGRLFQFISINAIKTHIFRRREERGR